MSAFIRCSGCRAMWRPDVNILNDVPMWFTPRKSKLCKHDSGVEVWTGTGWDVRPLVQFARGGETHRATQNPSATLPHSQIAPSETTP